MTTTTMNSTTAPAAGTISPAIMAALTDQTIATDMLITAKTSIKDIAVALSETTSPQIRTLLRKQFDQAVTHHEQLTNYMMSKGWYTPTNITQQLKNDLQFVTKAINLQ
ncbi:spore coat protein [Paenibacillus chartarius]|uniref:Spore coat protein n=1 Tax=Paenibacillus chartarius TaxID=747481 RepID=A0ABV6DNK5_9BACL